MWSSRLLYIPVVVVMESVYFSTAVYKELADFDACV
jgi:hypothetical protein